METINQMPQFVMQGNLAEGPSLDETRIARKQLSNGKAPGLDMILSEIYNYGGTALCLRCAELF